jgi:hypothetical protein
MKIPLASANFLHHGRHVFYVKKSKSSLEISGKSYANRTPGTGLSDAGGSGTMCPARRA